MEKGFTLIELLVVVLIIGILAETSKKPKKSTIWPMVITRQTPISWILIIKECARGLMSFAVMIGFMSIF